MTAVTPVPQSGRRRQRRHARRASHLRDGLDGNAVCGTARHEREGDARPAESSARLHGGAPARRGAGREPVRRIVRRAARGERPLRAPDVPAPATGGRRRPAALPRRRLARPPPPRPRRVRDRPRRRAPRERGAAGGAVGPGAAPPPRGLRTTRSGRDRPGDRLRAAPARRRRPRARGGHDASRRRPPGRSPEAPGLPHEPPPLLRRRPGSGGRVRGPRERPRRSGPVRAEMLGEGGGGRHGLDAGVTGG